MANVGGQYGQLPGMDQQWCNTCKNNYCEFSNVLADTFQFGKYYQAKYLMRPGNNTITVQTYDSDRCGIEMSNANISKDPWIYVKCQTFKKVNIKMSVFPLSISKLNQVSKFQKGQYQILSVPNIWMQIESFFSDKNKT